MTHLPPIPLFSRYPLCSLRNSESPTPGKVHLPPLTRRPHPRSELIQNRWFPSSESAEVIGRSVIDSADVRNGTYEPSSAPPAFERIQGGAI